MNVLDLYRESSLSPRRVSGTHGGEWAGPCPRCSGEDRFRIWPEQNEGAGTFWCRGCNKGGDGITFLIEYRGMKYPEAAKYLGKELPEKQFAVTPNPPRAREHEEYRPEEKTGEPSELWQAKATAFVTWATERLMQNNRPLAWLKERGIRQDTARRFCLGWNPGENGEDLFRPREAWGLDTVLKENGCKKRLWLPRGLVVPWMRGDHVRRIRIRRPSEDPPRYYVMPGSEMDMMVIGAGARAMIVVESELDAILLAQEAGELAGVVALGSSSAKPDAATFAALKSALVILNALDADDAGAKASVWWEQHFPDCERWPVPLGKDPGEAYHQGVDLHKWVMAGLPRGWFLGPIVEKKQTRRKPDQNEKNMIQEKSGEETAAKNNVVPEAVQELADILRKHPVAVVVTAERLTVRESQAWVRANWSIAKRLSELVFSEGAVFDYLHAQGAEVIDGKNILEKK